MLTFLSDMMELHISLIWPCPPTSITALIAYRTFLCSAIKLHCKTYVDKLSRRYCRALVPTHTPDSVPTMKISPNGTGSDSKLTWTNIITITSICESLSKCEHITIN